MANEFVEWKAKVNIAIQQEAGITADDIPDYNYYRAFNQHVSPERAAKRAIGQALLLLGF